MTRFTTTPVDVGTVPGDGTGDPAYVGGGTINSNDSGLAGVVNELASGKWVIDNTSETLALGDRVIANNHAGITKTMPAATALVADDYNVIWVFNSAGNSNLIIAADSSDSLTVDGATSTPPATYTLRPGYAAMITYNSASEIEVFPFLMSSLPLDDLKDVQLSGEASGDVLYYDGLKWVNATKEAADIVDRAAPALEKTPYHKHETRGTVSSGTTTVDCTDDPSVDVLIGGNNVTINLNVPSLSLPVRGLSAVKLAGKVFVKIDSSTRTGLTVTTDATSELATFPKGNAPTSANERAILVWEWYDNGTDDFMWAEWVNDD